MPRRNWQRDAVFLRARQAVSFARKEIVDVLHQPRLLITLVLGPFLVMAAFGIGYSDSPKPLRTMLVAPENSSVLKAVEENLDALGGYVDVVGVSTSELEARRELIDGHIDVMVSFPQDPMANVLDGEQAQIVVVHTRLDPIERTTISYAARLAVDSINAEVLASVIRRGQDESQTAATVLDTADGALTSVASALDRGDQTQADASWKELDQSTSDLLVIVRAADSLSSGFGEGGADQASTDLRAAVDDLSDQVSALRPGDASAPSADAVASMRDTLATIRTGLDRLAEVDPAVLVQPFVADVDLAVKGVDNVADWYAPAAAILVVQQFGIAFGALTFVRERSLGINDVFRVAPVTAGPALIGKYIAYLLLGGLISAILQGLLVGVLDVPMAGSIAAIAIVLALTLFASIGIGFVISLASKTDAQAVQYTMLMLLASLFFSGFFLSLGQIEGVGWVISHLLPVSYGMSMLRDVMLRGADPDPQTMVAIAGFGVVLAIVAAFGLRRRMGMAEA